MMKIIASSQMSRPTLGHVRPRSATIDGVHRGHQWFIAEVAPAHMRSAAIDRRPFDPHPARIIRPAFNQP